MARSCSIRRLNRKVAGWRDVWKEIKSQPTHRRIFLEGIESGNWQWEATPAHAARLASRLTISELLSLTRQEKQTEKEGFRREKHNCN